MERYLSLHNGCKCSCYDLKMAITVVFATVMACRLMVCTEVAAGWSRCPIMDSQHFVIILIFRDLMFWHSF